MMEAIKIKNKGQAQLFENNKLEVLTKANPVVIWTIYTMIITAMIYYSHQYEKLQWSQILILFVIGSFSWTLFEYLIHRFLFHFMNSSSSCDP